MSESTTEHDQAGKQRELRTPDPAEVEAADSPGQAQSVHVADASRKDYGPPPLAAGSQAAQPTAEQAGMDPAGPGFPESTENVDVDEAAASGEALLVQEGEIAGDYLEQLLDILDYDGDIDLDVEGSRAIVAIVGANELDPLVGARGVTLDALQELTRLTVAQQTGVRTRLMLDIGGYRAGRRTELSELAATNVARVIDTGETLRMSPMNAFERKIVHDVVTATDGVRSESEGEDPDRRVVILPDR